jgi:tetratricopeptide (TPR) repeat protein
MSDSTIFHEAKEAIRNGDTERARDLLARLLRTEKNNPEYWLWMSSVVYSQKEKIYCLKNVIRLDSENVNARQGLIMLGGMSAGAVEPRPPVKRAWETDLGREEIHGWQRIMANPILGISSFLFIALIVLGLILGGIFSTRGMVKPQLTITPIAWTPTQTRTQTLTPVEPTVIFASTPTPQPLWMLLDATYTPTPIYVNTPHTRIEAYRLAIRAYQRGDYENMVNFLEQTLQDEPEAVDVIFYLGEAYAGLGDFEKALKYYEDALLIDQEFAPVYFSRARLRKSLNPAADILDDLNKAIQNDPLYSQAYYERAIYWFERSEYESALSDLHAATDLMPFDPRIYLLLAKVNLAMGEYELALEHALNAYRMDMTQLEVYLVLSEVYMANNRPKDALSVIETYGLYKPDDPVYLALLGGIHYLLGEDYEAALRILERAKTLDNNLVDAFYYHGLTALKLGDTNQAINDFYIARNLKTENLEYSVWFGIALYEDERYKEAFSQFDIIDPINLTDIQSARYFYYKAKTGMELSLIEAVRSSWLALLDLPRDYIPPEWIIEAEAFLSPFSATPLPGGTTTATNMSLSPTTTLDADSLPSTPGFTKTPTAKP